MSELISSATVLCCAPEPQHLVLYFLSSWGISWRPLADFPLGWRTKTDINRSLLLQVQKRQRHNFLFSSLLTKVIPVGAYEVDYGRQHKIQFRLNLLGYNIKYFICKPGLLFFPWHSAKNTTQWHFQHACKLYPCVSLRKWLSVSTTVLFGLGWWAVLVLAGKVFWLLFSQTISEIWQTSFSTAEHTTVPSTRPTLV